MSYSDAIQLDNFRIDAIRLGTDFETPILTISVIYERYCEWCELLNAEPMAMLTFTREFQDIYRTMTGLSPAKIAGKMRYPRIVLNTKSEFNDCVANRKLGAYFDQEKTSTGSSFDPDFSEVDEATPADAPQDMVSNRVTPVVLEIMLACYTSSYPSERVGHLTWNSKAGSEVRRSLAAAGLITDTSNTARATARGRVWVKMLLKTPPPACKEVTRTVFYHPVTNQIVHEEDR